jgi:hypothetical protein
MIAYFLTLAEWLAFDYDSKEHPVWFFSVSDGTISSDRKGIRKYADTFGKPAAFIWKTACGK